MQTDILRWADTRQFMQNKNYWANSMHEGLSITFISVSYFRRQFHSFRTLRFFLKLLCWKYESCKTNAFTNCRVASSRQHAQRLSASAHSGWKKLPVMRHANFQCGSYPKNILKYGLDTFATIHKPASQTLLYFLQVYSFKCLWLATVYTLFPTAFLHCL